VKVFIRSALAMLVTANLVGCATTLPTIEASIPVPASRVLAFNAAGVGNATLTIVRDKSFAGSAVDYLLLIDGVLAARIGYGEYVALHIPAGERIIELRHPSPLVGAVGDSATLRVDPGARYYYRINSDVGQLRLLRTTAESIGSSQP
jgi:hypothetical protein